MLAPLIDEIDACLRFYSRLSLPAARVGFSMPDFGLAARSVPLAGALIGACGAAGLFLARAAGAPPMVAAACAIAVLVAVTGALHEDGLADLADGFGGGATRERKLEIMRDSRLGSYGACALTLSLILRVAALAAIAERGSMLAALTLIAAGAVSRAAGLLPMIALEPARGDGAGAAAPRPSRDTLVRAFCLAALISFLPALAGAPAARIALADCAALLGAGFLARLARQNIGGFTGDVLGAAQQASEIAVLLVLAGAS